MAKATVNPVEKMKDLGISMTRRSNGYHGAPMNKDEKLQRAIRRVLIKK